MRIGVLRHQSHSLLISVCSLGEPLHLIQNVPQIEKRQRILRIGLGCTPVKVLRNVEVTLVVINRPKVDRGRRVIGLQLENRALKSQNSKSTEIITQLKEAEKKVRDLMVRYPHQLSSYLV